MIRTVRESTDVSYNTIAPPENGRTDELINSVLYADGKAFSMPVSVDELEGYVYIGKDISDKQVITSGLIGEDNKILPASADQDNLICEIAAHRDYTVIIMIIHIAIWYLRNR